MATASTGPRLASDVGACVSVVGVSGSGCGVCSAGCAVAGVDSAGCECGWGWSDDGCVGAAGAAASVLSVEYLGGASSGVASGAALLV